MTWRALRRLLGLSRKPQPPEPRTTTYAASTGLVEVTAPVVPGCPVPEVAQAHHQFITSNWAKLAAAAYAGFQRHGIGVVVIERREKDASPVTGAFETHTLAYATGMGMWTQHPPHSAAPDWLDEQFQTYEPLEAGLFLFRPTETSDAPAPPRPYHATGSPAPPEALRRSRAPFN